MTENISCQNIITNVPSAEEEKETKNRIAIAARKWTEVRVTCDISPLGAKCEYDEKNCCFCVVCKLECAINELLKAIPIIGKYRGDYICPRFEPEERNKHNE